jgi:hypothetical protein
LVVSQVCSSTHVRDDHRFAKVVPPQCADQHEDR